MKRLLSMLATAVALCLTAWAAPVAVSEGGQRRCPAASRVIDASSLLRLHAVSRPDRESTIYSVCSHRGRLIREIGWREGESGVQRPQLTGGRVAFEDLACDDDGGCSGGIFVWRFGARPALRRVADVPPESGAASDLVLLASGAVATIRFTAGAPEVTTIDSAGVRVHERGGVVAGSLAASGSWIYWRDGQGARAAQTTGAARTCRPGSAPRTPCA